MSPVIRGPYPDVVAPTFQSTDFTDAQGGVTGWAWKYGTGTIAQVDGGTIGGKVMQLSASGTSNAAVWGSKGSFANAEILCKFRQSTGTNYRTVGVGVRLGGDATTRLGYWLEAGSTGGLLLYRYSGSSRTSLTVAHPPYPASVVQAARSTLTWYWQRLRIVAGVLYGKMWQDGAPEPSDWQVAAEDTTYSAAGEVGFYRNLTFDTHEIDYFAVSDGSTIPLPT